MPEKARGIVTLLFQKEGAGIIAPVDGSRSSNRVLFYRSSVNGEGYRTLESGMEVEFEVCPASLARGMFRSMNVTATSIQGSDPCSNKARLEEYYREHPLQARIDEGCNHFHECLSLAMAATSYETPQSTTSIQRHVSITIRNDRDRVAPEVIDLVTPTKKDDYRIDDEDAEGFSDLCIGESLSAEDVVAQKVKEAVNNGQVIDLMTPTPAKRQGDKCSLSESFAVCHLTSRLL